VLAGLEQLSKNGIVDWRVSAGGGPADAPSPCRGLERSRISPPNTYLYFASCNRACTELRLLAAQLQPTHVDLTGHEKRDGRNRVRFLRL